MKEINAPTYSGYSFLLMLPLAFLLAAGSVAFIHGHLVLKVVEVLVSLCVLACFFGFFVVAPNDDF